MSEHVFFYPYRMPSKSILELRRRMPVKVIRPENSQFRPTRDKLVVNWGSSALPLAEIQRGATVLNVRSAVQLCANKERFFNTIQDNARIPEWTNDAETARGWVRDGVLVVGREKLNGHSGEGIRFSDENLQGFFEDSKIFVKYVPKKDEFRVHIFRGRVIDVQQKRVRTTDEVGNEVDRTHLNYRVRSYKNGFVFARENVNAPEDVLTQAINAFNSIPNLDFGAVDVIWNRRRNEAYVLEINTAPGLEGTSADNYAREFIRINETL